MTAPEWGSNPRLLNWWSQQGSNLWPLPCQGSTLPLSYGTVVGRGLGFRTHMPPVLETGALPIELNPYGLAITREVFVPDPPQVCGLAGMSRLAEDVGQTGGRCENRQ